MSRRLYSYRRGEPVWARLDGHPWWPGRVVTPDEIICDEGEPRPNVKDGELLIEFFDETNSFAPLKIRHVRPFLSKRRTNIHRQVDGTHNQGLEEAISRVRKYVVDNHWTPAEGGKQASVASVGVQYTPTLPLPITEPVKPQSKTAQSPARAGNPLSKPGPRAKRSRQLGRTAEPAAKRSKQGKPTADMATEPAPDMTYLVISKTGRPQKRRKKAPAKETVSKETPVRKTSGKDLQTRDTDVHDEHGRSMPPETAHKRTPGRGDQNTVTMPTVGRLPSEDNHTERLDHSAIPSQRKKRTIATETLESSVIEHGETYISLKKEMACLLRDRDDRIAALHARMEKLERDDLIRTGQEMIKTGQELIRTGQDLVQKCGPVLESVGGLLQRVASTTEGSSGDVRPCSGFLFMANK